MMSVTEKTASRKSAPTVYHLSESLEDYLEAILAIEQQKQAARPKDIAMRLSVSAPSVTAALQNLAGRGLVNYAPYDLVTLTPRGRRLARGVRRRHLALHRFFTELLHIDADEADVVACHMEHSLPSHILARLVDFMDFLDKSPHGDITWTPQAGYALRCVDTDAIDASPRTDPPPSAAAAKAAAADSA